MLSLILLMFTSALRRYVKNVNTNFTEFDQNVINLMKPFLCEICKDSLAHF